MVFQRIHPGGQMLGAKEIQNIDDTAAHVHQLGINKEITNKND